MPQPPTPVELRRKRGNPSKRKLPDPSETGTVPAAVQGGVPDPARPLGAAGGGVWETVLHAGAVWIAESDLELLQQVCEQVDEQQALRRTVFGVAAGADKWRERAGLRRLDEQIRRGLSELGLTPTARTRLGLAQVTAAAIAANTSRSSRVTSNPFAEHTVVAVEEA